MHARISAAALADTTNGLKTLEQTSFQGTMLRELLLEAYAFSTFGAIALSAGMASFTNRSRAA
ncbi:MAG: hypothetical protein ACYCXY_12085 [Acidimicrobiales bacterium]